MKNNITLLEEFIFLSECPKRYYDLFSELLDRITSKYLIGWSNNKGISVVTRCSDALILKCLEVLKKLDMKNIHINYLTAYSQDKIRISLNKICIVLKYKGDSYIELRTYDKNSPHSTMLTEIDIKEDLSDFDDIFNTLDKYYD